ncbi:hypothetical protein TKK_0018640 [Trichogramma kaykai]
MRVCSNHFKPEDYVLSEYSDYCQHRVLKKQSVPLQNLPISAEEIEREYRNEARCIRLINRTKEYNKEKIIKNSSVNVTPVISSELDINLRVSPAGLITFVSDAYGGRASDTAIFSQRKLVNMLEPDDGIMKKRRQFPEDLPINTSKIACARIHVERINQRLKVWSMISSKMPVNVLGIADEIFTVLCATVNMTNPILSDDKFKESV